VRDFKVTTKRGVPFVCPLFDDFSFDVSEVKFMSKENTALQDCYSYWFGDGTIRIYVYFADYDTGAMRVGLTPADVGGDSMTGSYARDGSPSTGTSITIKTKKEEWRLRADNFSYTKLYGDRYDSAGVKIEPIVLTKSR
jgi:hypothetical protein